MLLIVHRVSQAIVFQKLLSILGSLRDISALDDCVISSWIVSNTFFDLIDLRKCILVFKEIRDYRKTCLLRDAALAHLEYQLASIVTN